MSLFDSASLVVTPNGYKAGKLYSIKPTSGAGDLDVVRATSATRVNASGLIEIPRTNLLLRSEEFDNAIWTKTSGVVVTSNSEISPNGTLTADTINFGASNRIVAQATTLATGVVATGSIYVKGISGQTIQLAVGGVDVLFTLNGNWQKLEATRTSVTSVFNLNTFGSATARIISVWGAQLELGNVATEYIPTTSVIRTRFAGITQDGGSANNIPRLDYTNASCPSILVEPQRTNLLLRSEEFDSTYWVKNSVSVTANNTSSPSGTMTADLVANTSAGGYINNTSFVGSTGSVYSFSFYIKNNTSTSTLILVREGSSALSATINWSGANISSITNTIGSISSTALTNGWFRIMGTYTALENNQQIRIYPQSVSGTNSVFLWGAQLEVGANATSYIPTQASTVTRNADVISKTGVSSLIGQTEGTIYWDIAFVNGVATGTGNPQFGIRNTAFTNWIGLTSNNLVNPFRITARATTGLIIDYEVNITSGKAAVAWSSAGVVLYVNGVQVRTSATNPNFSFDRIDMIALMTFNVKGFALLPTRLSNTELAQLTTL